MKKIGKILLVTIALSFFGCEESTLVDDVFDETSSGTVLRTLQVNGCSPEEDCPLSLNLKDVSSNFTVTLEEQDESFGEDFEEMRVYLSFTDDTPEDTISVDEVLFATIPASSFTPTEKGLPSYTFSETLETFLGALGLTSSDPEKGDFINVRFGAVVDGKEWSLDQANNNITGGAYFSSPFIYSMILECELAIWPEGDWIVAMEDSSGDGWQTTSSTGGRGITVTLSNGDVLEVGLCSALGEDDYECVDQLSEGTGIVTFPAGITSADWVFPGDFLGEISFTITSPNGNVVAKYPAGSSSGSIELDLCDE
ncbi:MAG: hypothetical protein AAGC64_04455 [Bacteroidota bacterium]